LELSGSRFEFDDSSSQSVVFSSSFEDQVVESLVFIEETVDLSGELVELGGIASLMSESFVFSLEFSNETVESAVFIKETVDLGGELVKLGGIASLMSESFDFSSQIVDDVVELFIFRGQDSKLRRSGFEISDSSSESVNFGGSFDNQIVESSVFIEETVDLSSQSVNSGGISSLESGSFDFSSQVMDDVVKLFVFSGEEVEFFSVRSILAGAEFKRRDSGLQIFDFMEFFLKEMVKSAVFFKDSVGLGGEFLTRSGGSLDSFFSMLALREEFVSGAGKFSLGSLEVSGLFNE